MLLTTITTDPETITEDISEVKSDAFRDRSVQGIIYRYSGRHLYRGGKGTFASARPFFGKR